MSAPDPPLDDKTRQKLDRIAVRAARLTAIVVGAGLSALGAWGALALVLDMWRRGYLRYSFPRPLMSLVGFLTLLILGLGLLRSTFKARKEPS